MIKLLKKTGEIHVEYLHFFNPLGYAIKITI